MGKALYRTHRSKKLSEVVGQDHITKTLQNALDQGKISHAYLFTGPKGVGKTSIARILAHEINKLPYEDDKEHIDIIEIDAASNRRIDEIRDLRDKARLSPLQAPYKVYIIDEVHMLTREAFNALLKTLEEPPEHVIFILATTESHKLPETIISRTQRYNFKAIEDQDAVGHLKAIAKQEKIAVDDEALGLIARHGNGSFRDSISLLDQISNTDDKVTGSTVRTHLGVPPDEVINNLVKALVAHDSKEVLDILHGAQASGYQAPIMSQYLSAYLRGALLDGSMPRGTVMDLLRGLLAVPGAPQPYQELELVLLEASLSGSPEVAAPSPAPKPPAQPATETQEKPAPKQVTPKDETPKHVPTGDVDLVKELEDGLWEKVLDKMRGAHNTLYGVARMAAVSADGNVLVLGFAFQFHMRRFNEARNQDKLHAIITEVLGDSVEVRCEIDKDGPKTAPATKAVKKPDEPAVKSDTLDSITKVFGGGEVLED
jgi:DNA polymerase-3 subunit gamma/tau